MKTSSLIHPPNLAGPERMDVRRFFGCRELLNSCLDTVRLIPSSAGFTATPAVSEAGLSAQPSSPDINPSSLEFWDIRQWADAAPQGSSNTPLPPVNPPSPSGTTSTVWSELTADAGDSVANLAVDSVYCGDWMSLPFSRRAATFALAE
jgi:hypothetical protein